MNKKILIPLLLVVLLLAGVIAYLYHNLQQQRQANHDMQELAELDKQEMENEYENFARQYSEMKTQINNDSIIAQLTQEQMRTQELLKELQQVKATDAREIARLKKELATVRAVLRSYVYQIDSLNRLNESLRAENSRVRDELAQSTRQNEALSSERASLSEKVAIAAQLDATGISLVPLKDGKPIRKNKLKKANGMQVSFTIARNVTATNGNRTVYVRIKKPNGDVLPGGGSFAYQNKQLTASMKKSVEYTGEAVSLTTYWSGSDVLGGGTYHVSIFVDGNMIGSATFGLEE